MLRPSLLGGLLAALLPVTLPSAQPQSQLRVYTDSAAAGWAMMDSCVTFKIDADSACSVSWTVSKIKPGSGNPQGRLTLSTREYGYGSTAHCSLPFRAFAAQNRIILDSIFARWGNARIEGFGFPSFQRGKDYSWNIPVAIASARSEKYRDYRKHYPKVNTSSNALFVEFANQSDAYKELQDLFVRYGLDVRLQSVEKVFAGPVSESPFKDTLLAAGLKPKDRILWDAGSTYFSLNRKSPEAK